MKKIAIILAFTLSATVSFGQDKPLEISGSADLYYKYDISKTANIPTSFATDQNSVSLGMFDVILKKKTGKTSFLAEVSFGPRGAGQSIPDINGQSYHIQNLFATYEATEKLTLTAGYMSTFIGYEEISPLANFHYSTSYLFTNGPFQNGGIKGNYAFSKKIGLMVGMFNDQWNAYQANSPLGLNAIGAQLSLTPSDKLSAHLNYLSGSASGKIIDLTAKYQMTDKFKLGLNAADYKGIYDNTGYSGVALYPSYKFKENFSLGLRAESYKSKSTETSYTSLTLTGNIKSGGLTFIPEVRLDNASQKVFVDANLVPIKTAAQICLAVVYGF
jgi:hypothetical protein